MGVVTGKLAQRKGRMLNCADNSGLGRVPSPIQRALARPYWLPRRIPCSAGTGIANSYVEGYEEWRGDFPTRYTGSIVFQAAVLA